MAVFADGKIEAYVGPRELGAADDLEQVIVDFIAGAESSLDIAAQELDSEPIAQAIVDARWRGVSVTLVLEQDYLRSAELPRVRLRPGETEADARRRAQWVDEDSGLAINRRILGTLLRSGVQVWGDLNPEIFHQKFIVRDYRDRKLRRTALLSGSANFTSTDTHTNLNHVVVFHDWRVCSAYRAEVVQLRSGRFGRGEHGKVPATYGLAGVPVKVLFAPDHTPELELIKQMLKAERRIDFAIFTFAGSSGIDDAMVAMVAAGRSVRGALDPVQGRQWWAATPWLHEQRVEVFFPRRRPGFRKLHHKLMVIDEAAVVAGSMNYTAPANEYNDENIFVIGSPHDRVGRLVVDHDRCAEIARFFRAEIDRIVGESDRFAP
jgi:phosphatidylserine/phosphatidylglycerophosphate/cardiolipin synthase-like enzyme